MISFDRLRSCRFSQFLAWRAIPEAAMSAAHARTRLRRGGALPNIFWVARYLIAQAAPLPHRSYKVLPSSLALLELVTAKVAGSVHLTGSMNSDAM